MRKQRQKKRKGTRFDRTFSTTLTDGTVYKEKKCSRSRVWSWELAWEHWSDLRDMRVLEIGPRYSRDALRNQLKLNGCEIYTITYSRKELKRKNTVVPPTDRKIQEPGGYRMKTSELSKYFEENFFDIIIGIESFEHWGQVCGNETGSEAYQKGISECAVVLKPGGRFEQEVPVRSHGHTYFTFAKWDELDENFPKTVWGKMELIEHPLEDGDNTEITNCGHINNHDFPHMEVKCGGCCGQAIVKWKLIK